MRETRFAVMSGDSNVVSVVENWLSANNVERNIAIRSSHFLALGTLVRHCNVAAIIPTGTERIWLYGGDVAPIELPFVPPVFDVNMYWHRIFDNDERNKWLRRHVTRAIAVARETRAR